MDDLSSLDWNSKSSYNAQQQAKPSYTAGQASFRATPPIQTILTPQPFSRPSSSLSAIKPPLKPVSPANDSFANLLSSNASKGQSNLTLQDRQKQLQAERQKQIQEQQRRHQEESQLWDTFGTGSKTGTTSNGKVPVVQHESEADILAAFSATATVDRSSHFPPPVSAAASGRSTPAFTAGNGPINTSYEPAGLGKEDDDDPFGLGSMPQKSGSNVAQIYTVGMDDDDILGDLGKPVAARPRPQVQSQPVERSRSVTPEVATGRSDPLDNGTAELMDMGFPTEKARQALLETNGDIQAAVSWLLTTAHEESRQRSNRGSERPSRTQTPLADSRAQSPRKRPQDTFDAAVPAWMRQESRPSSAQRRQDNSSPAGERDVSQYAQEIGSSLFKSAGSLWKQGQKRLQKTVSELQQERDASQPRWMRDASTEGQRPTSDMPSSRTFQDGRSQPQQRQQESVTDEALLLESRDARPNKTPRAQPPANGSHFTPEAPPSRGRSPAQPLPERPSSQQRLPIQPKPQAPIQPSKLSRQAIEDEAAQAYVSSSRRRRPPPVNPEPEPEIDLFSPAPSTPAVRSQAPTPQPQTTGMPARIPKSSTPAQQPPVKSITRAVPPVSPSALATSARHRTAGTEAFKQGDYAKAHESYTAALSPLPPTHPITIIVLCNRALTAIKTGEPKVAVDDADKALSIIGPDRGENEVISTGASEPNKDMKEFYAKALTRKAEALEAMEKWSEAHNVWRTAVEAGVGGLVAVRGRDRCAKSANPAASAPKPTAKLSATATRVAPTPRKGPASSLARPEVDHAASAEAVRKLRAANLEAEKADDEKFALSDAVSARIEAWKGGKSDNLRALLGSLENVLWADSGWKKVGMAELVLPNKVKIIYMKAIAKVHPDKIPQSATTEQKMISGNVFSTLNEAWDKFKRDNGL